MWLLDIVASSLPFYRACDDAGLNYFFDSRVARLWLEGVVNNQLK